MKRACVAVLLATLCSGAAWAQDDADDIEAAEAEAEASADDEEDDELPEYGRGPFEVRDPYLIALSRTAPWARSPEVLDHLEVETSIRFLWVNSYAFRGNGRIIIDAETREFTFSLRMGLFDRVELGLMLPYQWRGGGVMDRFIINFHRTFGLPGANRDKRPEDRYLSRSFDAQGTVTSLDHRGYGLGDMHATARVKLTDGGVLTPALTASLRLRLPTGRSKFEFSDGVDATLQLDAAKRILNFPFVVYSSLAFTYYAHAHVGDLEQTRTRWFFSVGAEWEILDWISVVAHLWVEERRERQLWDETGNPVTDPDLTSGNYISYIAAGFKIEPTEGLTVEIGALENILDPDVTADLGFMINASYRF